jgi:hypothetical protein
MPKKISHKQYVNINDKKGVSTNDSKSKNQLKLGSSEFIYSKEQDGNKKNQGIFFEDDIKDEDVTSSQNYWYRGELMKLVPDALNQLMEAKEVVVEQKIELMEVLTGCETPNRYNVYLIDRNRQKTFLFKCKEESNWFCRNCLPSSNRSFFLRMHHIISSNKKTDYKKTIADFERPFKCTCLCCCRPIMEGFYKGDDQENQDLIENKSAEQRKEKIGIVIEPFGCAPELLIYGTDGQIRWKIYGEYCQCGFWARDISVGKCYEVDFWIYEADADVSKSKPVGNIHKVFKGLSELVTDSDAFILTFPIKSTAIERLMLIGSVIMIDYRYYEDLACCECINLL